MKNGTDRDILRDCQNTQFPLGGRIASICDIFDALTSKRPYKEAWPLDEALNEIKACSGTALDPKLVECFFKCLPELIHIKESFQDESWV